MMIIALKKFSQRHNKEEKSIGFFPPVTLIVTAYNEEKIIHEKIKNLLELDYPADKIRMMIIADGSTDDTKSIVAQYPAIQLLYLPERKGKYAAIKRAVKQVTTPVIIFSDANTMLNSQSIKKMVQHFSDPKTGGVAGEKKIINGPGAGAVGAGEGLYWQYESFMKKLDAGLHTVIGAAGELFSIRTELFRELSDDLIIDDFVISMQICLQGYRIAYEPEAFSTEPPSATLAEEEKRKVRISAGAYQSVGYLKDALNLRHHSLLAFQFISRRLLRWLFCPPMLILFFISNACIVFINPHPFYNIILLGQLFFYLMATAGWALVRQSGKAGIFTIPFYFVFMNYCLVKGLIRYRQGRQSVLWEKALRQVV
jgi:cellulose synthase/poly-beta-1,6-N-acetylglucosamine synthase-like glycosyltransferase